MPDPLNAQPGAIFAGDYRILQPLSTGGMGAVYVAEQISTGRQRALKLMLPQLVADPSLRKRFEQEARIASLIDSEHVVEVVGAGVDPGTGLPWLAMELLNGEDLSKTVARRGAISIPEVLLIFEQLCHAVGAAHRANIVHRDLKPENIFLAQAKRAGVTFTVKVLDFGIAKVVAEAKTSQTAAMGSPIWMAPEQADRSPITPATDVWALGLIAFHLLTGRYYWESANHDDATMPQLMREILFEPIVVASKRSRQLSFALPPAFDAWFGRCVVREPAGRFSDAGQAWAAFASALGPSSAASPAKAPFQSAPPAPLQAAGGASGLVAGSATGAIGSYTVPKTGATSPPAGEPPARTSAPVAPLVVVGVVAVMLGALIGGFLWYKTRSARVATVAPVAAPSTTRPVASSDEQPRAVASDEGTGLEPLLSASEDQPPPPPPPVAEVTPAGKSHAPAAVPPASPIVPSPQPGAAPASSQTVSLSPSSPAVPVNTAPASGAPPAPKTAYQLASSHDPADWQAAHAMLEADVYAGRASTYNIRLLEYVCKNQRDRACLKECKRQLRSR